MSTFTNDRHVTDQRVARCRQLSVATKQQLTAQMALLGWRFPSVVVYGDPHIGAKNGTTTVNQFTLVSPIGEEFRYFLDTIEDAGFFAFEIWNDKSQAMWTGRKLEDFE